MQDGQTCASAGLEGLADVNECRTAVKEANQAAGFGYTLFDSISWVSWSIRPAGCFTVAYSSSLGFRNAYFNSATSCNADCGVDNAVTYLLQMEATRPVVTWRLPHQRLKRRLTVYFRPNNNEPPAEFRRAVMDLQPGEKLWVCALTKSAVQN